jgi:molybdate/tungstate transport system substrate-binding protein
LKIINFRRPDSPFSSKAIATAVAVVIVVVILVAAVVGYLAYYYTRQAGSSGATSSTSSKTSSSFTGNPLLFDTADAYANESLALESGFTAQTGIPMATPVSGGSSALAANICAGDPVSVFLSVARSAVQSSGLCSEFPGWAVAFAGDQMGLAYTQASTQSGAAKAVINAYNTAVSSNKTGDWFEFFNDLTSGSVKVGISDPNTDPAGFRGWLVLQLAGLEFATGNNSQQYFVNRTLANHVNITSSSAAALVPSLDTGQIQFLFIYKSDIVSEGFSLIQLPNSVNLGIPSYNSLYSRSAYTTSSGVQKGSAIVLWLSVPKDSTDLNDSIDFVVYTIENYQTVLKNFGLTPITPCELYNTTGYTVPSQVASLVNSGTLVEEGPV